MVRPKSDVRGALFLHGDYYIHQAGRAARRRLRGHGGKVLSVVEVAQPLQDLGLVEHVTHFERQLTQQHVVLGLLVAAENDVLDVGTISLLNEHAERYGTTLLVALFDQLDDVEDVSVLEVVVLNAHEVLFDEVAVDHLVRTVAQQTGQLLGREHLVAFEFHAAEPVLLALVHVEGQHQGTPVLVLVEPQVALDALHAGVHVTVRSVVRPDDLAILLERCLAKGPAVKQ